MIKEVCDFTLYDINDDGSIGAPALYLDTLKISTVEQTADSTSAHDGKGNSELVMWDFGREITLNLQDALFSAKSMAIMFGDADGASAPASGSVLRTWNLTKLGTLSAAPTQLDLGLGKKHTVSTSAVYYTATALLALNGVLTLCISLTRLLPKTTLKLLSMLRRSPELMHVLATLTAAVKIPVTIASSKFKFQKQRCFLTLL